MANKKDMTEAEKITYIRARFLEDYYANSDLYDECDLKKVNNDFWISRFINFLDQGLDKSLEHMKECFRWRKSFGVNTFDRTSIPREVYQMGAIFQYKPDARGRHSLIIRVKMHRKISVIEDRLRKSLVNYMERIDAAANQEFGWNLIFDCQGSGYQNADLDMVLFVMHTIRRYFPNGVRYVFLCGLPWVLNSVARLAIAFMPSDTAKKIRFVTPHELQQRLTVESLPDFLGGTCKDNYRWIPKGAKSCQQLGEDLYGLTNKEIDKMMAPSLKYIQEGEKTAEIES